METIFKNFDLKHVLIGLFLLFFNKTFAQPTAIHTMKIDPETKTPRAIYNVNSSIYTGTPEEIARQYLLDHRILFKMKEYLSDLEFVETKTSPAGHHVCFRQVYDGIPVNSSETVISINRESRVSMVINHYQPEIRMINTKPSVNNSLAIQLAKNSIAAGHYIEKFLPKTKLMIYKDDKREFHLVQKVEITSEEPFGSWIVIVDAESGEILSKSNAVLGYINGEGTVFKPDPGTKLRRDDLLDYNDTDYQDIQPAYLNVTLNELDNAVGGVYKVRGKYAWSGNILDLPGNDEIVTAANANNFKYKRNQNGFEEVNVYYFIDAFRRYVGSRGFAPKWEYLASGDNRLAYDARGSLESGAWYEPVQEYMYFGVPVNDFDRGEDLSVIVHEYGHALHDALISGENGINEVNNCPNCDLRALSEGLADYLAISYRRSLQSNSYRPNHRNNWSDVNQIGIVDDSGYGSYPTGWVYTYLENRRNLWASTLMEIEYQDAIDPSSIRLGRDVTAALVLNSLYYVTDSDELFENINAILQADRDIYEGEHIYELVEVFEGRGFFDEGCSGCPQVSKISGVLTSNQTWQNIMLVEDNVTVNTNVTLTIEPETFVFFNPSKSLTINGKIKADSVTFLSVDGSQWQGIYINGQAGSYIKNSQIKDCVNAVQVNSSGSMLIYGNDLQASNIGIWVSGSGNPNIEHNYVRAEGEADILFTNNAVGKVIRNSFRGTAVAGHKNQGSASPYFNYYNYGRNEIIERDSISIRVDGGVPQYNHGNNAIYESDGGHINNYTGNTIYALYNYWETTPDIYGPVVYTPVLTTVPNPVGPNWSLPKSTGDEFDAAWMAFADGDYTGAKRLAETLLQNHKSETRAAEALFLAMKSALWLGNLTAEKSNLTGLRNDAALHTNGKYETVRWLARDELQQGKFDPALELVSAIPNSSLYGRELLLDIAIQLFEEWGDFTRAETVLDLLVKRYPDEETKKTKETMLARYKSSPLFANMAKKFAPDNSITELIESYLTAHPNPFNPTTKITYSLDNDQKISIKIYNLLGKEVKTLFAGVQKQGIHEIIWDAKDNYGSGVASGVYLVQMVMNQKAVAKKILYLK